MAGDSVSTLILFIAAMLVAAGVAGTLVTNVNELSNSVDTHSAEVTEKIDTDIEIISDPGSDAVYNASGSENITILVKNTGQETLPADGTAVDVLVNGSYVSNDEFTVTVRDGGGVWRDGTVAELEIDRSLATPAEHRVVVTVNGAEEVFEFYAP
ncbi:flagellar protein G [Natrinema sp. 1APR25-10V2]|uniref:flagellar protein G n=1 Tax=Natrinema sp. 1APR25-10V2 TaxID=2951081 RepID=UPI002874561F|nr:flagellar protein G [Natrinema sp. 1APR25-10V2]MDS0476485.1 flagellar protein G [Natrinema sp. 1APR25-10V2]